MEYLFIKISFFAVSVKITHFYHFYRRVFHFNIFEDFGFDRGLCRVLRLRICNNRRHLRGRVLQKGLKIDNSAQNLRFFFSRASKAATIKAFRSTTPSLDAMRNVKKSQQFSSTKTKPTRIRPGALPDPETLYDELEASRKEIAAQKQLINSQVS